MEWAIHRLQETGGWTVIRKTSCPARQPVASVRKVVGTARFELATPCPPCKCATGLRYVPTEKFRVPAHSRRGFRRKATI